MPGQSDRRRIASVAITNICVVLAFNGVMVFGALASDNQEVRQPVKRVTADLDQKRFVIPNQQRNAPPPAAQPPTQPQPQPQPSPDPVDPALNPKHPHFPHHGSHGGHFPPRNGRFLNQGTGVYYSDALYYRSALTGVYSPIDPNLVIEPVRDLAALPPPPPTLDELIRAGLLADAESMIRSESPEGTPLEPAALRMLAYVESLRGDFYRAASLAAEAYVAAPSLAGSTLSVEGFYRGPSEYRRHLVRAVRHAHAVDDAGAWLVVSMLMQADGRDGDAVRMIERASALGLDAEVVDAWLALSP